MKKRRKISGNIKKFNLNLFNKKYKTKKKNVKYNTYLQLSANRELGNVNPRPLGATYYRFYTII